MGFFFLSFYYFFLLRERERKEIKIMETFVDVDRFLKSSVFSPFQVDVSQVLARLYRGIPTDEYMFLMYDDLANDLARVLNKVYETDAKYESSAARTLFVPVCNLYFHGVAEFLRIVVALYPKDLPDLSNVTRFLDVLNVPAITRPTYEYRVNRQVTFSWTDRTFSSFRSLKSDLKDKLDKSVKCCCTRQPPKK